MTSSSAVGAVDVDDVEAGDVADPAGVAVGDQPQPFGPAGAQLLDGALRDDPAGAEHDEPVAEPLDQVELVAGEEHGDAAGGLLAQQVRPSSRPRSGRGPENGSSRISACGSVEQRGDDLDPLLVAEAELLDPVAGRGRPRPNRSRCSPRPTARACAAGSPESSPR